MYKTLADKSKVFKHTAINKLEELEQLLVNVGNKPNLRYRGVCEAKYTMLTSLQRNAPAKMVGCQKDYMSVLLNRVKIDADVIAFFKGQNIPINDISCMALMQHLELPTPLLDFSIDINIALSFAEDGVNMASGSEETDEYVSLYVIDLNAEKEVAASIQQMYQYGLVSGEQMWKEYLQQHPNQPVDGSVLFDIDKFIKWDDIKDLELSFVEYQALAPNVVTLSGEGLDLTNPNLANQKGCFILNLYDEGIPMEENWNMRTIASRNMFWQTRAGVQTLPFSGVQTNEQMYCWDIKKDVIQQWAVGNKLPLYVNSPANVSIKMRLKEIQAELDREIG